MNIAKIETNQREKKNYTSALQRLAIAQRLAQNGTLTLGNDELTLLPGNLVNVKGSEAPVHPINGDLLDNPMTLDTFMHIYLLDK